MLSSDTLKLDVAHLILLAVIVVGVLFVSVCRGRGLRVEKKKKVEKCVLLLLVNWLLEKWLSSLSERRKTGCVGKNLFFFFIV